MTYQGSVPRMYNIRAKKQLSQNFIMDPKLLNKIVKVSWMDQCDEMVKGQL